MSGKFCSFYIFLGSCLWMTSDANWYFLTPSSHKLQVKIKGCILSKKLNFYQIGGSLTTPLKILDIIYERPDCHFRIYNMWNIPYASNTSRTPLFQNNKVNYNAISSTDFLFLFFTCAVHNVSFCGNNQTVKH